MQAEQLSEDALKVLNDSYVRGDVYLLCLITTNTCRKQK